MIRIMIIRILPTLAHRSGVRGEKAICIFWISAKFRDNWWWKEGCLCGPCSLVALHHVGRVSDVDVQWPYPPGTRIVGAAWVAFHGHVGHSFCRLYWQMNIPWAWLQHSNARHCQVMSRRTRAPIPSDPHLISTPEFNVRDKTKKPVGRLHSIGPWCGHYDGFILAVAFAWG